MMLKRTYIIIAFSLCASLVPACAWDNDGRMWGDERPYRVGLEAAHTWEVYEDSTVYYAFSDTLFSMWRTASKVLGYDGCSPRSVLKIQSLTACVNSSGRILRLTLRTTRPVQTQRECEYMNRLLVMMRKFRFPPFDRMNVDGSLDAMCLSFIIPRPKAYDDSCRQRGW